jgi:hypothetical protein
LLASGIYSNIHEEFQYPRIFFLFEYILIKHLDTELKNVQLLKDCLFRVYVDRVYRLNHADLALTYPEAFAEQRFQPKICSC